MTLYRLEDATNSTSLFCSCSSSLYLHSNIEELIESIYTLKRIEEQIYLNN